MISVVMKNPLLPLNSHVSTLKGEKEQIEEFLSFSIFRPPVSAQAEARHLLCAAVSIQGLPPIQAPLQAGPVLCAGNSFSGGRHHQVWLWQLAGDSRPLPFQPWTHLHQSQRQGTQLEGPASMIDAAELSPLCKAVIILFLIEQGQLSAVESDSS